MSYPDTITRDTNLNLNETQQVMRDKATWHHFIKAAPRMKDDDEYIFNSDLTVPWLQAVRHILILAAGDLLALVVVIFHITEFFPPTWPVLWAFDWQCSVHRFFRFVGFNNTVLTMTAIAVDRFYAVKHPVTFRTRITAKRTKVVVGALWVVSNLAAVPTAFMFQSKYGGVGKAVTYPGKINFACKLVTPFGSWFKDFKSIYLNIVLFYLPVIVTAALYVLIVLHVWKNNKFIRSRLGRVPHRNSHWKTAKTLLTVFLVYVSCYILLITYNLLARYAPKVLPPDVKNVGLLLPYVNSCMNPIVYSFTNPSFRDACRTILHCKSSEPLTLTMAETPVKETEGNSSDDPVKYINGGLPHVPPPAVAVIQTDFTLCEKTGDERKEFGLSPHALSFI
ncbi:allatostatin-A receptor-like [Asterias rubens]|uniref:allatostatin-A receptor-like n=1 Tax=Asterias rubens TaxID=7604 RepID=UPI0014550502|nr:allatostatin-A receptor-like [Asterias rubens]